MSAIHISSMNNWQSGLPQPAMAGLVERVPTPGSISRPVSQVGDAGCEFLNPQAQQTGHFWYSSPIARNCTKQKSWGDSCQTDTVWAFPSRSKRSNSRTSLIPCFKIPGFSSMLVEGQVLRDRGLSEAVIPSILKAQESTFYDIYHSSLAYSIGHVTIKLGSAHGLDYYQAGGGTSGFGLSHRWWILGSIQLQSLPSMACIWYALSSITLLYTEGHFRIILYPWRRN